MGFAKKNWKDRLTEFPGRRRLKNVSTNAEAVYDVARNEGEEYQTGDAFSAANMNDLEQRISEAIGTGNIPPELGGDIISAINALNTGRYLINGTVITNTVPPGQNVTTCKIVLPAGTWLITSHVSFTTSVDATYAHALIIGQMEAITVRTSMDDGGGTAIPYLVSIPDTTTVIVIVNTSSPVTMTLESNLLRAIKLA